jgi:hypothetical protein
MATAVNFTVWMNENENIATHHAPRNPDGTQGQLTAREWCCHERDWINSGNPALPVSLAERKRHHCIEVALAR